MKKRLPFLIFLGIGMVLWRGGFGFLAMERSLTWRFPVSYADVRRIELQVWEGDALLKRHEQAEPAGLRDEPSFRLPLSRGALRGIGTLWFADAGIRSFQTEFDPGWQDDVVIAFDR